MRKANLITDLVKNKKTKKQKKKKKQQKKTRFSEITLSKLEY